MNRIISINIRGVIFQIEEDAFDYLDAYIKKLKRHFSDQDGMDEILSDIETRIAEMLTRNPGLNGSVDLNRVKEIVSQMGDPAQFDDEASAEQTAGESQSAVGKRKLYRDNEGKWLGGVCSGLGAYFDIDPLWIRIAFLFAFFTFGTGLLLYILLWVLIPEAVTASERLEMKGKKVTIDNIEKTIREEFDRFKQEFDDSDIASHTKRAAKSARNAIGGAARKGVQAFSRLFGLALVIVVLIGIIVLGFAYFGFLIDLWRTPFFPFFQNLFESQAEYFFYSISLASMFLIPVIGALYLGVRLLLGLRNTSPWIGRSLSIIWLFSIVFTVIMVFQLSSSWSEHAVLSDEMAMGHSDTLFIESANTTVYNQKEYTLEFGRSRGIRGIYAKENGQLMRPVKLSIVPSDGNEFMLKEQRHSNGKNHEQAAELASKISHSVELNGNHLVFNPYYSVDDHEVWKNQFIEYTLYVPIGKVIVFGSNTAIFLDNINTDNYIHNSALEGNSFVMTRKGLNTENTKPDNGPAAENFFYNNFNSLSLEGIPELILFENESYKIYTESGANYTPQFEESGNNLRVYIHPLSSGQSKGALYIGMPALQDLEVVGDSKVSINFHQLSTFKMNLIGAVKMEGELIAENISLESNGVNQISLQGKTHQLKAEINGSGNCDVKKLIADDVKVEANGASHVTLFASDNLKAEANGGAEIYYSGNPKNKKMEQSAGARIAKASD